MGIKQKKWGKVVQSGGKFVTLKPCYNKICVDVRFLGNIEAKIDSKGRAFLPAQFRKVLAASGGDTLVLRQDVFESLLVLYPEDVWNKLMDDMRHRLSRWDRKQQMAYRTFVSSVVEVTIDGNGRILIPRSFLDLAGIKQSIRFVGMGDTIEIWSNDSEASLPTMSKEEFGNIISDIAGTENEEDERRN